MDTFLEIEVSRNILSPLSPIFKIQNSYWKVRCLYHDYTEEFKRIERCLRSVDLHGFMLFNKRAFSGQPSDFLSFFLISALKLA